MFSRRTNAGGRDDATRPRMTVFLDGLLAEAPEVSRAVFDGCFRAIARRANQWMRRLRVCGPVDGEDVANDVLFKILRALQRGKFPGIQAVGLARVAGKMTTWEVLRKCNRNAAVKRGGQGFKKRDAVAGTTPRGGESLVAAQAAFPLDIEELADELADPGPSPEAVAAAHDEAMWLSGLLKHPRWPEVLRLRREGDSIPEIARKTGRSVSSVERLFRRARERECHSRDSS